VVLYLDTSALVKFCVPEAETAAMQALTAARPSDVLTSSVVSRCELMRAVRRRAPEQEPRARAVLSRVRLLAAYPALCDAAALLSPLSLRSLDAIHIASALELGDDLAGFVSYDGRQRAAAEDLGLPVLAPA
jgi:uncharacterized protein